MSRQDDAIRELESSVDDLLAAIDSCPDSEWHAVVPNGWTRAAVAMHCATGNDTATGWLGYLISRREILDTPDFHDRVNGEAAERHRLASKKEVQSALKRSTARTTRYIRSLTDDEVDRPARHGLGGRDMTAASFLPTFSRHIRQHTEQFRSGF